MTRKTLKSYCSNEKVKAVSEGNTLPYPCPDLEQVAIYFSQKGMNVQEAERFFAEYEGKHWQYSNGAPIIRWKQAARLWIADFLKKHPWLFDKHIH